MMDDQTHINGDDYDDNAIVMPADTAAMPNMAALGDVSVRLSVEVGSIALRLTQLMELVKGSVVELDRQAHELLDIMANGTLIARGEVVTANGRFAIRVVEVVNRESCGQGHERRS